MKITIAGVGQVGTYYAEKWHRAGHQLTLTYYRDRNKVDAFAAGLGSDVSIAPPVQAIADAEVILFCPRFEHIQDLAEKIGDVGQRILIDANNPFNPERTGPASLPVNQTAATLVASLFPSARQVKALHNLGIQTILNHQPRKLIGFVAGDDTEAVGVVSSLLSEALLDPMPTGSLSTSALSEYPGPLFGMPFNRKEAETTLEQARAAMN
jgi:predicted dinucleotide-binding enzyme